MACKGCSKNKTSSKPARSTGTKTWSSPKPKSSEKVFVYKDGKKFEIIRNP